MPAPKPRRGNRGQAHREEVAKRVEKQRAQRAEPGAGRGRGRATGGAEKRGGRVAGRVAGGGRAEGAGGARVGAARPGAPASSGPKRALGGEQVEGRRAVRELLIARRRRVRDVWLAEGVDDSPLIAEIEGLCEDYRIPVRRMGRDKVYAEARTDAPQGVIAHADPLPEVDVELLARKRRDGAKPFLVVLDGITDPHNLGAILRSAECAGATGVVLPRHRSALVTPTVAKAAAGAIEYLPISVVPGIPAALSLLKEKGVWTVGLDADGEGSIFALDVATEPVAVVLGNEGTGLSRLVRQRCDVVVAIPQLGELDSLNVSAAGTLACYEVARRRAV